MLAIYRMTTPHTQGQWWAVDSDTTRQRSLIYEQVTTHRSDVDGRRKTRNGGVCAAGPCALHTTRRHLSVINVFVCQSSELSETAIERLQRRLTSYAGRRATYAAH